MSLSLSNSQIKQIIQSLDMLLDSGAAQERRRSPRHQRQAMLAISSIVNDALQPSAMAVLQDYSDSGLGLVYLEPLDKGQTFRAQWTQPDGQTVTVGCRVTSCTQMEDGAYRIGAQFAQVDCPDCP